MVRSRGDDVTGVAGLPRGWTRRTLADRTTTSIARGKRAAFRIDTPHLGVRWQGLERCARDRRAVRIFDRAWRSGDSRRARVELAIDAPKRTLRGRALLPRGARRVWLVT